ncbi:nucleotidyltransferase domain-containing protein [Rhodocista pekingensis]|uniref:Nucleotidyltransferase domain-containing protein n=1 Tax=Rhodocista pekingensis TaxID=201185 RepID=A0ABW2KRH0_9PROT
MSVTPAPATGKTLSDVLPPERVADLMAFRRAAEAALPGRVAGVVLFGSRARGDADADSDYDVAVFIRGLDRPWDVIDVLSDLTYDKMLEGIDIRPVPLRDPPDPGGRRELLANIARDGVPVP